jgi:hypothetical protein
MDIGVSGDFGLFGLPKKGKNQSGRIRRNKGVRKREALLPKLKGESSGRLTSSSFFVDYLYQVDIF